MVLDLSQRFHTSLLELVLPVHHEGWMISDQETVFCWVPVPYLTMVVSSVAFYLLPTYKQPTSRLLVGW
jgi:hypothetical protein